MAEKGQPAVTTNEQPKPKKTLLFVILGVVVILLAVKVFLDHQEKKELEAFYRAELEAAEAKLDKIEEELNLKITEIDSLGGSIDDLIEMQQQITAERDQLQRTRKANRQLIARLRRKTDGYEELLREKDKEIIKLKEINAALASENTTLKVETNKLNRSLAELNQDKQKLEEKVSLASRLKAEDITLYAITKSGKEKAGTVLKKRQLAKLKVTFTIAKNDVAPLEAKEILIRLIDENGQVIFDVNRGSGSFILDGKETFYTASQDILFDNSGQQLSFIYEKGTPYDPGNYTMEVYTDGYLMGAASFTVR